MTESEETANRLKQEHSTVEKPDGYEQWVLKLKSTTNFSFKEICELYEADQLRAKQAALVTAKNTLKTVEKLNKYFFEKDDTDSAWWYQSKLDDIETEYESVIKHLE